MFSKKTLTSKLAILALCALLVFLGNIKYKQWQRQKQIDKEVQTTQQQVFEREKQKIELSRSLEYLNSSNFKERVAREQLGLKRDGEQVYGFSDAPEVLGAADDKRGESNFKKWLDYFFAGE